ncbi:MAG: hypothetical protein P8Q14_00825 [Vicingaceae bacterium]|nr:hypothetical protein [Vicingaceae bacterium]
MKTLTLFLEGVSVDEPFTFSNGFTLGKVRSFPDFDSVSDLIQLSHFDNPSVLYISVPDKKYNQELFELGVFTTDMISLLLRSYIGIKILAASDFYGPNVPNVIRYGISQNLKSSDLKTVNENIQNFDKRTLIEKERIQVALMYLNKSKICATNVNGNYEHSIFIRVALENCFGAPRTKINSTIARRASILLDQFDPNDVNKKIKRFYSQTSGAVHTGKVPKKPKNNTKHRKVKIENNHMHDILTISVKKVIALGFPEWDENPSGLLSKLKIKICALFNC